MTVIEVDDTNNQIAYYGTWDAYAGGSQSTRQWEGSIHSTSQNGASATITFIGTRVVIYCTVPVGSGTDTIGTITFDGQKSTVTRKTSSNAVYADLWYDSGPIANIRHTITIANGGSSSDSPLQLDRFHVEGDSILNSAPVAPVTNQRTTSTPSPPTNTQVSVSVSIVTVTTAQHSSSNVSSSSSSSTSSSALSSSSSSLSSNLLSSVSSRSLTSTTSSTTTASAGEKTVTAVQFVTTAADGSVTTQFVNPPTQQGAVGASSTNVGAIVGGVIGGLVLLALIMVLLCLRRRRRNQGGPFLQLNRSNTSVVPRRMTDVTPFHRASRLEQPPDQQDPEMSELAAEMSASDHHDDNAGRRLPEKNPTYYETTGAQSPLSLDSYARNRIQTQYGEVFDQRTSTSMYASTVFSPPESSNNRPPSYQSARPPGSATRPNFPLRDEKSFPPPPT